MQSFEIDRPLLRSLLVLATVIEARDPFTGGHVWRTSRYARLIAEAAGLDGGDVFLAQLGGLVHDLGKIGIPDSILSKEGRVTVEEYRVITLHPEIGRSVVANHPLAPLVERPVWQHHLRMDGTGYPNGPDGVEPWIVSRVVSVADAFDAMTSFRPYRGANPVERAVAVLQEERGRQFDASLADAMLSVVRRGAHLHVLGHAGDGRLMVECPDCGPIVAPPAKAADGDLIECPSCTGEFVLHIAGDTFELEWMGTRTGVPCARPDPDAVEDALRFAPPRVAVEPDPD